MYIPEEIRKYPFIRLLLPLVTGILLQLFLCFNGVPVFILLILCLFSLFVFTLKKFVFRYPLRWLFGVMVYVSLILLGMLITYMKGRQNEFEKGRVAGGDLLARVLSPPDEKDKSMKVILKVTQFGQGANFFRTDARVLAYFQKDSLARNLKMGDEVICRNVFTKIRNAGNPHEFNSEKYWANHGVYLQGYLKRGCWQKTGESKGNPILLFADRLRIKLQRIFSRYGLKGQEYAVVSALTIGARDKLDEPLVQAYAASGAMHVLSVSGLHVGIVYLFVNYLLFFLDKRKGGKLVKNVLIILLLWFYALLSGMSSPIIRSAIMLSFIVVSDMLKRPSNTLNSLAASIFLLLCFNPLFIMDVSFQLSYAAVISIVLIYQKIYLVIDTDNWLMDKIWSLVAVSIAAQLGTFPISLYYFHQFPNYFLLTNMLIIPLTNVIIYVAIALFIFSPFTWLAGWLGKILSFSVNAVNQSVLFIEHLPHSVSGNIQVNEPAVLALYLLIVMLSLFFISKKIAYLKFSLLTIVFLLFIRVERTYSLGHSEEFFVYNVRGASVYHFIEGEKNVLIADSSFYHDEKAYAFSIKNNWIYHQLKPPEKLTLGKGTGDFKNGSDSPLGIFASIAKYRILVPQGSWRGYGAPACRAEVDYLVLSNKVRMKMAEMIHFVKPTAVIIDSSCPAWQRKRWIAECKLLHLGYFVVQEKGAFCV